MQLLISADIDIHMFSHYGLVTHMDGICFHAALIDMSKLLNGDMDENTGFICLCTRSPHGCFEAPKHNPVTKL
jgi:hypothetical protein